MIPRDAYLSQLVESRDNGQIKVIVGTRRVGKSFLLKSIYIPYLMANQIEESHIVHIALDQQQNIFLHDPAKLRQFILDRFVDEQRYYLFLDEIQLVSGFEWLLNELREEHNVDIYVTGSNSQMLSSDIATIFRGRGDIITIYPLVFSEYYSHRQGDVKKAFEEYLQFGGMPQLMTYKSDKQKINYLEQLFSITYVKDIVARYRIKKVQILDDLIDFLCSNIGSLTSIVTIENTLKSRGFKNISDDTIAKYISYLQDSFLVRRVDRFDVKGKRYLARASKYYLIDVGLRNARLNFRQLEFTHLLENVIYLELLYRGFQVDVGSVFKRTGSTNTSKEIDFIARLGTVQYYIQVAYSINDAEKLTSETESFSLIDDGFRKIILTYETSPFQITPEGYHRFDILDFLLDPNILSRQ